MVTGEIIQASGPEWIKAMSRVPKYGVRELFQLHGKRPFLAVYFFFSDRRGVVCLTVIYDC